MHIFHAQPLVPQAHSIGSGTSENNHPQAHLHRKLYCIAVLDIYSPERLAVTIQYDGLCTQDTVHVKNNGFDGIQVVVDHTLHSKFTYMNILPF